MQVNEAMVKKLTEKADALVKQGLADCEFKKEEMFDDWRKCTVFDNTKTIAWWIAKKHEYLNVHRRLKAEWDRLYAKLLLFYKSESNLKINTNKEFDAFINADEQSTDLKGALDITENLLKTIDGILDALKGKNYEIKRFIEWEQFKAGK